MNEFAPTSLKQVINSPIFLKCEYELPYGGGNKVRRFIQWLDENPYTKEVHIASDKGSHSFLIMNYILKNSCYQHIKGIFWEKENSTFIKYRENNRQIYLGNANITTRKFSIQFYLNWFFSSNDHLYSLGGKVNTQKNAYEKAMNECIHQLNALKQTNHTIWHLLPLASGTMSDAFLSYFRQHKSNQHKLIGLLTGDKIYRKFLKTKYLLTQNIYLLETETLTWNHYVTLAQQVKENHQIVLDPIHTCHLWNFLRNIPDWISSKDLIVVWLTQPFIKGNHFI